MKFVCAREPLLAAFQTAATVVPARSPKTVIRNVKIEAGPESLTLFATDLEVAITLQVSEVETETAGRVLVPVSQFGAMLRESTDEKLMIESDVQGIAVRGEHSELKFPSENPDEFPDVPTFDEEGYHEVSARLFKEVVRRTLFASDAESSRYPLGGVLLEMKSDHLIGVATDGRRLAKMEGPAQSIRGHQTSDLTTIVPIRAMQLIDRALHESDAEIQIAARANDILVKSPRATLYSRLVDGRFPNWRDVFPARTKSVKVELTVGPFYAALRQASIVASDESRGIELNFSNGSLVLSGSTAEVGQSRVELPVSYTGDPIRIKLNHRFLADLLKVLDPEKTITLDVEGAEAGALFETDDGYSCIVMPLSTENEA